jgi:hypothetical protein
MLLGDRRLFPLSTKKKSVPMQLGFMYALVWFMCLRERGESVRARQVVDDLAVYMR